MEFDQEAHDKILIMAEDIKFIREQLDGGKETFKEHREKFEKHGKRIRTLEQNQQLLTGKLTIIIILIGATMLFIMNLITRLWK